MTSQTHAATRRGLAALIPSAPSSTAADQGPAELAAAAIDSEAVEGLELIVVAPADIVPNPRQPRTAFDPDALTELAHSLLEVGFLQPIVVRQVAENPKRGAAQQYEFTSVVSGVINYLQILVHNRLAFAQGDGGE